MTDARMTDATTRVGAPDDTSDNDGALQILHTALGALARSWPIVVACTVLGGGAGLVATKMTVPIYEASTTVEFDPNPVQPLSDREDGFSSYVQFLNGQESQQTQYHIIVSDRVLKRVVADHGLASDAGFLRAKSPPLVPPSPEVVSAMLRSRTSVDPIKGTRLFVVKVKDTDPKRARVLSESIVQAYLQQNAEKSLAATSEAATWLTGQVSHFQGELEANEERLHEFKAKNELPSSNITEVSNAVRTEMMTYLEAVTRTRTARQALEARAKELAELNPTSPAEVPNSEVLRNTSLTKLRDEFWEAEKTRARLVAEGKGENHPDVKTVATAVAIAKDAFAAEVKNVREGILRDLAIIRRQEAGENELYEAARKRAVELNMKEIEYRRLDRGREHSEKLYGLLSERSKQADLARMMQVNNVRMLDPALEPTTPIEPKPMKNLGTGLGFGLLVGLLLMALRELANNTVRTPDDVTRRLGVTLLGIVPDMRAASASSEVYAKKSRRAGIVPSFTEAPELTVHHAPLSSVAEAARTIRTNLMFMNPDRPDSALLVSSAAPGEGKTTVACNIAAAMAQAGKRVCIVDCDLRKPRLHRVFQRVGEAGLTNVLIGEVELDSVIKPTVVGNLWCIPAGSLPPNPADLLHSVRLRSTVEELRASFDCVIFDTPPVGAVTDAAVLSTLVDGCLFVVRANKTARGVTRRGLASLRDIDARVLGAVLNSVDIRKGSYAYYYQSKYYGEAASTREPPGSPPAGPPGGGASPSGPAPSGTQPMRPGAAAAV